MKEFAAAAVLTDPAFAVPPVPPATDGVAWLRCHVARFSDGAEHLRRRALTVSLLDTIDVDALREPSHHHPVARLAAAMGAGVDVVELVGGVAQAYQPGTGDERVADAAVAGLVGIFGGITDELTAARIGILVQAFAATAALIARARDGAGGVAEALAVDPPVPATRRVALIATTVDGVGIEAGEVVRVLLAGDAAFGLGQHRCPGRPHALALVEGALA